MALELLWLLLWSCECDLAVKLWQLSCGCASGAAAVELWSCSCGTGAVVLWLPIVIVETWLWSCGNGAVAVVPELRLWNRGAVNCVELWL